MRKLAMYVVLGLSLFSIYTLVAAPAEKAQSSFNEVWNVVTVAPETTDSELAQEIAVYETGLPQYSGALSALGSILGGALKKAAFLTVQSKADYHDHFEKLVHANGICFAGQWEVSEDSPYTGLFARGQSALMIGRISAASPTTAYGDGNRSFGFAGKLFPTLDPDAVVPTANFFAIDNLNGTIASSALGVSYINEPPFDLSGVINPVRWVNDIFAKVDINPQVRPVYPIAYAGLRGGEKAVYPAWLRVRVAAGQTLTARSSLPLDFRDELSAVYYPQGLIFDVEVSDTSKDPMAAEGWQKIVRIRTSAMTTSYGCDRRLHFAHPTYKDPNL